MRRLCVVSIGTIACALATNVLVPSSTESASANGDTRTLHLYHTHTHETIDATFRVDGHYDPVVLKQLNHFLRDWRNDDEHEMDPRLFDAVWEAYRTAGATDRIQIYSAYRSPETNAMLRRRSRAVAEHSQHMLGKAMDTTMPGFPMERIREAGMKLQHGGVGWYPSANFVHLDVGGVRSWPRMSYDQLASLFPDGKTVHIASDGRTMPGYEAARVELAERGGTEVPPAQESQGFFAWLFGGGSTASAAREDEEDRRAPAAPAAAPVAVASAQPEASQPNAVAYAPQQVEQRQTPTGAPTEFTTAEAEPVDTKPDVANLSMPLPPRRPADLVEVAEVPMPPARPVSLASLRYSDAQTASLPAGGLVTSTASGLPMVRKSRLPSVITQGTRSGTPGTALAFAAVNDTLDAPIVPQPVARPAGIGKSTGLRAASNASRHREIVASIPAPAEAIDSSDTPIVAGQKLVGLRKAAHVAAEHAAL